MFSKIKSKKGFSMIELLAAITILGILSIVAIGSVQKILDKSAEEYYKEQENSMSMAAQSYFQKNRNKLPKSAGYIKSVKLSELMSSNYIDQIKSKSEKNCHTSDSYVEVIKYSQTEYQYVANLDCGSEYKTNNSRSTDMPVVTIKMPTESEAEDEKTVTIRGKIKGDASNNSKLISYSYVIYAAPMGTNRFKAVKNSGSVISRGKTKDVNVKVDQFLPAKIKVQLTAINEHGRKKVVTSPAVEYKEIKNPLCPEDINDTTLNVGSSTTWENIESRTIKVICRDKDGVGCARPFFTQVFTNEAKTDVITVKDRTGEEYTCRVNVYIDRNHPKLKLNIKNSAGGTISSVTADSTTNKSVESGWQKKKVTIAYSASDTLGLKSIKIQKSGPHKSKSATPSYNSGTTINLEAAGYAYTKSESGDLATVTQDGHTKFKITLTDLAGKKSVVYATVSYDATAPKLTLTNPSNGNWSKNDVIITAKHNDEASAITKLEYGYNNSTWTNWTMDSATETNGTWSADRNDTLYVRATDSAGNTTTKSTKVKIDKTKPTCTVETSGTAGVENWYRSDIAISLKTNDSGSKIAAKGLTTSSSTSYNDKTSGKQTADTDGTTWYGYVKDNAGNTGKCNVVAKKDTVKPTCDVEISSGTLGKNSYYKTNVGMKLTPGDALSGVNKKGLTTSSSTSYNGNTTGTQSSDTTSTTWYGYVQDKAGNTKSCSKSVKKDATGPSVTYSVNKDKQSGGWYKTSDDSPFKITIKCTDGTSGRSAFTIDGTEYSAESKSLSRTSSARPKTYTIKCTDKAGNTTSKTPEYYIRVYGRDSSCSCETYSRGSECGCSVYKTCRTSGCGCSAYNSCRTSACGCSSYTYKYRERKCNRGTCKSCVRGGTARAPSCSSPRNNTCDTYNYSFGSWSTKSSSSYPGSQISSCSETRVGKYNRQQTDKTCSKYKSCTNSACGCDTYKSCANKSCGCKTYKRCSKAGCETREKCWHYD